MKRWKTSEYIYGSNTLNSKFFVSSLHTLLSSANAFEFSHPSAGPLFTLSPPRFSEQHLHSSLLPLPVACSPCVFPEIPPHQFSLSCHVTCSPSHPHSQHTFYLVLRFSLLLSSSGLSLSPQRLASRPPLAGPDGILSRPLQSTGSSRAIRMWLPQLCQSCRSQLGTSTPQGDQQEQVSGVQRHCHRIHVTGPAPSTSSEIT